MQKLKSKVPYSGCALVKWLIRIVNVHHMLYTVQINKLKNQISNKLYEKQLSYTNQSHSINPFPSRIPLSPHSPLSYPPLPLLFLSPLSFFKVLLTDFHVVLFPLFRLLMYYFFFSLDVVLPILI